MAAAARFEYVENVHYVVHDGKVFIIDQTTHEVLYNPETASESRLNGGLAQAIEAAIRDYAHAHRLEEATVGLSLLTALPVDVIKQAMTDSELMLILAKARDFEWETAMSLLFLGAKDHRITASDLRTLENDYGRLNVETSRSVLSFCQSRKGGTAADAGLKAALYA